MITNFRLIDAGDFRYQYAKSEGNGAPENGDDLVTNPIYGIGFTYSDNDTETLYCKIYNNGIASDWQPILDELGGGGAVNVEYADLKALRDSEKLEAGKLYRITDYVTLGNHSINSMEHPFDLVVLALDSKTLSEDVRALQHEGDTYFDGQSIHLWKIKYSIDNDTDKFPTASATGKGVIYYMKDEKNNDAPYDFKNVRWSITMLPSESTIICPTFCNASDLSDLSLLSGCKNNHIGDASYANVVYENADYVSTMHFEVGDKSSSNWVLSPLSQGYSSEKNTYIFGDNSNANRVYSGGFNFKVGNNSSSNLEYNGAKNNEVGDNSNGNSFFNNANDNKIGDYCNGNVMQSGSSFNVVTMYTTGMSLGDFGTCSYNIIGAYSKIVLSQGGSGSNNNIGEYSTVTLTGGYNISFNEIGDRCSSITLNPECSHNNLGNGCSSIVLGPRSSYNEITEDCLSITVGSSCSYNKIKTSNVLIAASGGSSSGNLIASSCQLGSYCSNNVIGEEYPIVGQSSDITLGNDCSENVIEGGSDIILGSDCSRNVIKWGNSDITLSDSCCKNIIDISLVTLGTGCSNNIINSSCELGMVCTDNFIDRGTVAVADTPSITFESGCRFNKIGDSCSGTILLKGGCQYNVIGANCEDIEIQGGGKENVIGNDCSDILIKRDSSKTEYPIGNVIGIGCSSITMEHNCSHNKFGDGCSTITIAQACSHNKFDDGCYNITFTGGGLRYNIFRSECHHITLVSSDNNNKFGSFCANIEFKNGGNHSNTFGDNCSDIVFNGNNCHFGNEVCYWEVYGGNRCYWYDGTIFYQSTAANKKQLIDPLQQFYCKNGAGTDVYHWGPTLVSSILS